MASIRARSLVLLLWAALALLIGTEAYLALIACGVRIFGFQVLNCPQPAPERAAPAADLTDLMRRVAEAEGRLAERPACRAENLAPLAPPVQPAPPPAPRR